MPNNKRGLGDLISNASNGIEPIHRGPGLTGLFGSPASPRPTTDAHEPADEADQQPEQHAGAAPSARVGAPAQPPIATPTPRERRAPAARTQRTTNNQQATGRQRGAASMPQMQKSTTERAPLDRPNVPRQGKTFRLLPELARDIAVVAASRSVFEYIPIEEAIEQFLALRAAPVVTRPRDTAELARRIRKSYTLSSDIVRGIAVQSATWNVFEYEIVEEALRQYLENPSV